ncbi:hypothetical protein ACVWXO_004670 [Bradyrhizobium sp. LM2.7]
MSGYPQAAPQRANVASGSAVIGSTPFGTKAISFGTSTTFVALAARKQIGELAIKNRLPAMFPGGTADAAGLITYGTSVADSWRKFAVFADRIFKGTKPADLPVDVITRRELIFNLQTAQAIGVTIPPEILKRADRPAQ